MRVTFFVMLCVFSLLFQSGCGGTITPGDASVPWSRSEAEEESNHVFLTVMYNDFAVETLTATIFRDGEVFQTNSVTADNINFTIEGFLDQ